MNFDEPDPKDYRLTDGFKSWVAEVQAFMDSHPDTLFTAAKVQRQVSEHPRWDIEEALRACVNVLVWPGIPEYWYVGAVAKSPRWFGELDNRKPSRRGRVTA